MSSQRPEPLRTVARRNRDRILEVARDALAASGDASLNSIARKAGVGPATLYRHFPTRESLMLAVHRQDVEQLVSLATVLLAGHPPLDALRLWLDRLAHYARIKHGVADVLRAATGDPAAGAPLTGALAVLLEACDRAGVIRPGMGPADVLLLTAFLWHPDPPPGRDQARRLLAVTLDGLRAGATAG
ncbi:TetR/AcrR family transcriptional regulator [Sphaerisporangium rubeum]|uniref:AcrR family transcriptional regulator n=1 Tax=Sphaerisporangium rubeum TaxID=321317 RepID=A0A7X0M6Z0_9ACTN|nr:TetR/AcrR family transcriptional regulator [Sphaerisporangium rubeum]MBB6473960.1 AcrR family transcriptional regulator [Sphaerisporangium rubeum]